MGHLAGVGNDFFPGGVDLVLELRGVSGGRIFGPKNWPILLKIQILAYFRPKTH